MNALALLMLTIPAAAYEWREFPDRNPRYVELWEHGWHLGTYDHERDLYTPWDSRSGRWGQPGPCPVDPPGRRNFGLDRSRPLRPNHLTYCGADITRQQALDMIGTAGAEIPASSTKYRMVVIDAEPSASRIKGEILSQMSDTEKADTIVQAYDSNRWNVAYSGFVNTGKPSLYYLQPDGKVLLRWDKLEGGPAAWVEACRGKRPNYNPANDPNGLGGAGMSLLRKRGLLVPAIAGVVLLITYLSRRKS